ncbi:MAG: zinc ribbon domain-containing protein [Mobilitalea sp.]
MSNFIDNNFSVTEENDVKIAKSPISGKLLLKIFSLVSVLCFFLPFCTVSCSGEKVAVNGLKSTFGFEIYEQKIDGNAWCILLLLIPIAIFILTVLPIFKKIKWTSLLIFGGSLIAVIILGKYKARVNEIVTYSGADFVKFNIGYYINNLVNYLSLLTSLGMFLILYWNTLTSKIKTIVSDGGIPITTSKTAGSGSKNCTSCGELIPGTSAFCSKCGAKQVEIKDTFCTSCGTKVESDMKFCTNCGAQVVLQAQEQENNN